MGIEPWKVWADTRHTWKCKTRFDRYLPKSYLRRVLFFFFFFAPFFLPLDSLIIR